MPFHDMRFFAPVMFREEEGVQPGDQALPSLPLPLLQLPYRSPVATDVQRVIVEGMIVKEDQHSGRIGESQ